MLPEEWIQNFVHLLYLFRKSFFYNGLLGIKRKIQMLMLCYKSVIERTANPSSLLGNCKHSLLCFYYHFNSYLGSM